MSQQRSAGDRQFISPLAKKTAEELGIDLNQVTGTGPNARILKADVLEAKQTKPSRLGAPSQVGIASAEEGTYTDIENSNIRKVIAERLSFSKQNIPHYYVTVSVNMDNLMKLRTKLNNVAKTKISVNDMVIKAASMACVKVPETNSSWMGDYVRKFNNVNMSVAVQTPNGLMAPTIFNTNLKGLEEIAQDVKEIAAAARDNKLKPQ